MNDVTKICQYFTFNMGKSDTFVKVQVTDVRGLARLEIPWMLVDVCFCNVHIIGPIKVLPILRLIGTTMTNLENTQKSYVLFNATWRKNGTSYVIAALTLLIDISIRKILQFANQKSLRLPVQKLWPKVCCSWPWPLTYIMLFITRSTHEVSFQSFIRICQVLMVMQPRTNFMNNVIKKYIMTYVIISKMT